MKAVQGTLSSIGIAIAMALSAPAQAAPGQLRFAVSPPAGDPVWKTNGVKFEKRGECSFQTPGAAPAPTIAGRGAAVAGYVAKAPLFNPGLPQPNGSYSSAPDDGFNTLFIDMTLPGDPNSVMTCRGAILANGVDVTAPARAWPSATLAQIGASGPLTVRPALDQAKLAALPKILFSLENYQDHYTSHNGYGLDPRSGYDMDTGQPNMYSAVSFQFLHHGKPIPATFDTVTIRPYGSYQMAAAASAGSYASASYQSCQNQSFSQNHPVEIKANSGYVCMKTPAGHLAAVAWHSVSRTEQANGPGDKVYHYLFRYSVKVWQ